MSSLVQLAEREVLTQLKKAVNMSQATANYCCGGSIPISAATDAPEARATKPKEKKAKTNPKATSSTSSTIVPSAVAIRWDIPNEANLSKKILFPFVPENSDNQAASLLDDLLGACAPATFGLDGQDVLDVGYRKAGKLDRKQFSVDFNPYEHSIIDAISQILLPDIKGPELKDREEQRGVMAELYKLNIYSGPSGQFKAHVDTPRGATQFGSLVVCLPYPHKGGQLRVSHNGHSTFFDWSNANPTAIEWAAFYSDCEHEILQVETGHRITLTYNLYVSEHVGSVLRNHPVANPALSPLHEGAKLVMEQRAFLANGGILGFYCAHKYAHTRKGMNKLMPFALKGIDVAVFSVFRSLGLKVGVRPILNTSNLEWMDGAASSEEESGDISKIGDAFHELQLGSVGGYDDCEDEVRQFLHQGWPWSKFEDVIWLNGATREGWEVALAHMTYGNESSLVWHYSHAVILIEVPKALKRSVVLSA